MAEFYITQNDTRPSIEATLVDATGAAVDLTNAQQVQLQMVSLDLLSAAFEKACVIVDAALGKVRYDWSAGDTAVAGTYLARFEVSWQDGNTTSFPNDDPFSVEVEAELVL